MLSFYRSCSFLFIVCFTLFSPYLASQTISSANTLQQTLINQLAARNPFPSVLPPTNLSGFQTTNRFSTQTDIINEISWCSPYAGPTPVAYRIYRKANLTELAAVIPADKKFKFKDHNRKKHSTYTYFLVSVDAAGNQSFPVGIVFKGSKVRVIKKTIIDIQVNPIDPKIAFHTTIQFTATALYSDLTTKDITTKVSWASSNEEIATISNGRESQGLALGLTPGTSLISASLFGIKGSTTLTVTSATLVAIEVTPVDPQLAKDFTLQFTATGIFSDQTTEDLTTEVAWSSANPGVASISNLHGSKGLAEGLAAGTTLISASFQNHSGSTTLTVTSAVLQSIEIDPVDPTVAAGFTTQFTAIGHFSDGSTENLTQEVVWNSSDPAIAPVSNEPGSQGKAIAISAGNSIISASIEGITGTTTLTVTSATLLLIEVTPTDPSLSAGFQLQFTATGIFSDQSTEDLTKEVAWISSVPQVATIQLGSTNPGLATGLSPGATLIFAALHGVTGSTTLTITSATLLSIEITPVDSSLAAGYAEQFTAIGLFSDNSTENITKEATWISSNPGAASISNAAGSQGLATGIVPGNTIISAAFNGIIGTTNLTVTAATLVSIQVTPTDPTLPAGFTIQFAATGLFSDQSIEDLTTQVSWSSSNSSVATVSNADESKGLALSLTPGTTTIAASINGVNGSTTLTVTSAVLVAIEIDPENPSVASGLSLPFTAMGIFSNQSKEVLTTEVTWNSSNPSIAAISNAQGSQGLATGLMPGTTVIFATKDNVTGSTNLTVTSATLVSIEVEPVNHSIAAGFTLDFMAIGHFSDHSIENLTTQVTWISSNSTIASISNDEASKGKASALVPGSTLISATLGGVTGSTPLTVTAATLSTLQVSPVNPSTPVGFATEFTAIGIFSDGSSEDLTNSVIWESSNLTIASISNEAGFQGEALGLAVGTSQISAAAHGISDTTTLTVTSAVLVSIQVDPPIPTLPVGFTRQFTATGLFSDGSTEDLTDQATWLSSNEEVATISNAIFSEGLAAAHSQGFATISASLTGITGSTTLTVIAPVLNSITVAPPTDTIAAGYTAQYTATGHWSDGTTEDLTNQVTWESSNGSIASISNGSAPGLATGLAAGSVTIAAFSTTTGLTGTAALNVTPATLTSIAVTPSNPSVAAGFEIQFQATGTFSDASTEDLTTQVTWNSLNTAIAKISNVLPIQGLAVGLTAGTSTITASLHGITGNTTLTVTSAILLSITVTPANASMDAGSPFQYTATGHFSDLSTENLTNEVTWLSGDNDVIVISNAAGSQGIATGLTPGTTTITAESVAHSISGSTNVTVTCPAITITTPFLPNSATNVFYSQQIQTSGGIQPILFSLISGSLPLGLSLQSDGVISGTPQGVSQLYSFTVQATSECGTSATENLSIQNICSTVTITTSFLPPAVRFQDYDIFFTATGSSPITFSNDNSFGPLPPGMFLNPNGKFFGAPTVSGNFQFRIIATNACDSISKIFILSVK